MNIDPRILKQLSKVRGKRPLALINHIIKHGFVTSQELKDRYGYNHPPRAARDVREQGIPLVTDRIKGPDGRSVALYRFGNPDDVQENKFGGRKVFSKAFKQKLLQEQDGRCAVTGERFESRYLSVDHRVPYQISGDTGIPEDSPSDFMLISLPLQRQKSWSCEHCENWLKQRNPAVCRRCFWASPKSYDHVAMVKCRRVEVIWLEDEIQDYEVLLELARRQDTSLPLFIKQTLRDKIIG
jgi:hypothetical protein